MSNSGVCVPDGCESPLGSRKVGEERFEQGTSTYRDDVIANYEKQFKEAEKNNTVSADELAKMENALEALLDAKESNALDYFVVRQTIDGNGNASAIKVLKLEDN